MYNIDKYKGDKFQEILSEILNQKKISHAYLFVCNEKEYAKTIIKDFIKDILMIKEVNNIDTIKKQIDDGTYNELKEIKSENKQIKKETILELKKEFSFKSHNNGGKFYIIDEVGNLNNSSANSILKFLEEPESNIFSFLITENINSVIDTIKSRCIAIFLPSLEKTTNECEIDDMVSLFINRINSEKNSLLLDTDLFLSTLSEDRNKFIDFINKLIEAYIIILKKHLLNENIDIFNNIKYSKNKYMEIINILIVSRKKIDSNVNLKLIFDKIIIDISEVLNG